MMQTEPIFSDNLEQEFTDRFGYSPEFVVSAPEGLI